MVEKVENDESTVNENLKDFQEQIRKSEKNHLPGADFYRELLQQPACITTRQCDGCGKCEH